MDDRDYREVDFATYCPKCVHEKKTESDRPCCWCLSMPTNLYTDKPTGFEAKKNGKQKRRISVMLSLETILNSIMLFYCCLAVMMLILCIVSVPVIIYGLIVLFKEDKNNGNCEKV